ncbi:hypothetical protein C8F01DRAFT_1373035 [Mycena amicta]|nr:hypothetical protein C8F01DRAFT_1373035 [Mycena amicta]
MSSDIILTDVLPVLLASSWLNIALYTLELVLSYAYLRRRSRRAFYRTCVGAMLLFDTLGTLVICVNVCLYVMRMAGSTKLPPSFVPTVVSIFMTYATAAVEQTVMCFIFYTLTRNSFVTGVLAVMILGHMGLALASGSLILVLNAEIDIALKTASASTITCAVTDLAIAACLAVKVWSLMSPTGVLHPKASFTRKFFLLVISAGVVVALNTLLMIGLLLRGSPAFSAFFTCQGRVYALTLLGNFLVGIPFRHAATLSDDGESGSTSGSPGAGAGPAHQLDLSRSMGLVFDSIATGSDGVRPARRRSDGAREPECERAREEQEKLSALVRLIGVEPEHDEGRNRDAPTLTRTRTRQRVMSVP